MTLGTVYYVTRSTPIIFSYESTEDMAQALRWTPAQCNAYVQVIDFETFELADQHYTCKTAAGDLQLLKYQLPEIREQEMEQLSVTPMVYGPTWIVLTTEAPHLTKTVAKALRGAAVP